MITGSRRTHATYAALALAIVLAASATSASAQLPSPLRLPDVLRLARTQRAEVTVAAARARAAAQQPAIVSALPDPMVGISADHIALSGAGVNASFMVEQTFPMSDILGQRARAAHAAARRERADVDRVALDVEADAARAYLMLYAARRTAEVLQAQATLAAQLVDATNARYGAGLGAQADVLRAQTDVARVAAAQRATAAQIAGAEAMLATALGLSAATHVPALALELDETEPPALASALQRAAHDRPELRGAREEITRSQAETDVMGSMYLPMAVGRVGGAYTMFDGYGVMVGLSISVPIWTDRLSAGLSEARAMVDMNRADLLAMRRMIEGEVANARSQLVAARARYLAVRDEVLPLARQTVDASLAEFSAGRAPLVSVVEATTALRSSELDLVGAELDLAMARVRLARAMGTLERGAAR